VSRIPQIPTPTHSIEHPDHHKSPPQKPWNHKDRWFFIRIVGFRWPLHQHRCVFHKDRWVSPATRKDLRFSIRIFDPAHEYLRPPLQLPFTKHQLPYSGVSANVARAHTPNLADLPPQKNPYLCSLPPSHAKVYYAAMDRGTCLFVRAGRSYHAVRHELLISCRHVCRRPFF
jgi:hypothetical protein